MGEPGLRTIRWQGHRVRSFEATVQGSVKLVSLRFRRASRNPAQAGSCYVLSASEPFNEEMDIDFKRLANWLDLYGLPQYHIHVSGK
ncbi:MAG: hypothetical protein ABR962_07215 [Candidatus Bathyarchaeia archaeon]